MRPGCRSVTLPNGTFNQLYTSSYAALTANALSPSGWIDVRARSKLSSTDRKS
jgi:hypothetical protein